MSRIEGALRAILMADEPVAGLVGTRIYPTELPQNTTLPAVVYQLMPITGRETNDVAVLRYACFCDDFDGSRDLGDKVRVALDRYKGVVLGLHIKNVAFIVQHQFKDDETGHHICSVEVKAVYR